MSHSPQLSGPLHRSELPPQSQPRTPTVPSGIDADTMAKQTITYMNVFAEHSAAIRSLPRSEDAYQRIIDQGRVLPPETKWPSLDGQGQDTLRRRMEAITQKPATTVEDHLEICSAAQTLLLLQQNILSSLPYPESQRIEKKINELRAARRQQFAPREGGFRGLAPPPPLPPVERPDTEADSCKVTPDLLNSLLDFSSAPTIIGQKFRLLDDMDVLYQISSVQMSLEGHRFGVQYEGTSYEDIIDLDDLKSLLECSVMISTESNPKSSSASE